MFIVARGLEVKVKLVVARGIKKKKILSPARISEEEFTCIFFDSGLD